MDILSLFYFSELAKDLHMTRTANRLHLSQQTLSNHIQRLEAYYETQLLNRKPALSLTEAGETVLAFAELVLREQEKARNKISMIDSKTPGVIRFGASHLRAQTILPPLLPAFSSRFPQVEFRLTNANSAQLEPKLLDGSLDFAVLLAEEESLNSGLTQIHLLDDLLYLCMTDELLERFYKKEAEAQKQQAKAGAFVGDFSKLPFCISHNKVGNILQKCFDEAQTIPNIYLSDSDLTVSISACFQGLAACVLTKSCLTGQSLPSGLNYFPLLHNHQPVYQSLYLAYPKGQNLPQYANYFKELLTEQFRNIYQKEI